jgi:hypothetical protein
MLNIYYNSAKLTLQARADNAFINGYTVLPINSLSMHYASCALNITFHIKRNKENTETSK